ncbi:tautomerase family protein [Agromyces allii]|uniref:Tautomerase family protein n=1 Tax=Agromyces allii TaxID=393607 RepID=A0ABN2QT58_9MICO|nr:tautomerase family protein [Agromyces allii]
MPAALIEVRREYTATEEVAIMDAVHAALVAAFRIPPEDRDVRLVAHAPHRFACSPDVAQPEYRTLVTIDCFAGRSVEAKRALYAAIVERLEPLGIPRDHVTTIVHDVPRESWGLMGGTAASDVDLGFDVNV